MKDKIPNLNNIEPLDSKKPVTIDLTEYEKVGTIYHEYGKADKYKVGQVMYTSFLNGEIGARKCTATKDGGSMGTEFQFQNYRDILPEPPMVDEYKIPDPEVKKKKKRKSTAKSPKCIMLNKALKARGKQGNLDENSAAMVERCIIAYVRMMTRNVDGEDVPIADAWKVGVKGTPRQKNGKTIMTNSGDTKGVSDVHCLVNGRYLAVEVKFSKGDKQSTAQIEWEKRINQAGGTYIIVRNFTDFLPKFEAWYTGRTKLNLFNQK